MKLLNLFLISIIFLFYIGCSSSTETTNADETDIIIDSSPKLVTSENIKINIPPDWKEIKDNNEQIFEIWLVNKNENAVIVFIPIKLSNDLESSNEPSKFEIIEKILITKKQNNSYDFELIEEKIIDFEYENKSILYLLDDKYQNSILFGNGTKYYECLAYFHEEFIPTEEDIEELLTIQQEIVNNAIFN